MPVEETRFAVLGVQVKRGGIGDRRIGYSKDPAEGPAEKVTPGRIGAQSTA